MSTPTYEAIATITLSGSASSVTFSSIPADYGDLIVVINGSTVGSSTTKFQFNSDSGANYSFVYMYGDGSSAASVAVSGRTAADLGFGGAGDLRTQIAQVMDYTATDKHKTTLVRSNEASVHVNALAARWADTSAITSVTLLGGTSNWEAGSTFSLFGVAK